MPVITSWRHYPLLILGFNVQRWVNSHELIRLRVHDYSNRFQSSFLGKRTKLKVTVEEAGVEHLFTGELASLKDGLERDAYGPSPIQHWSAFSFQVTWPLYVAFQFQWDWIKIHQSYKRKFFAEAGWRWESRDDCHSGPSFFCGSNFN